MTGLSTSTLWLVIGFASQAIFTARFLVQWIASERRRDSVVPVAFWWLSLVGGLMLFGYAVHRHDPVFMLGQGMGVFIYVRNLMLVSKKRRRALRRDLRAHPAGVPRPHISLDPAPSASEPATPSAA